MSVDPPKSYRATWTIVEPHHRPNCRGAAPQVTGRDEREDNFHSWKVKAGRTCRWSIIAGMLPLMLPQAEKEAPNIFTAGPQAAVLD